MQFDDHEIWGAPVQPPSGGAPQEPRPVDDVAHTPTGRLYKSAGCEEPVEAIVALPGHHRRHTAAHVIEPTTRAASAAAPITINSQIPRRPTIDDPAIAEVLAEPSVPAQPTHSGFTSWFRTSGATPRAESQPEVADAQAKAPFGPASDVANGIGARLRTGNFTPSSFALITFIGTAVVGAIDTRLTGNVGTPTGIAFLLLSVVAALRLGAEDAWAGWVLPSYVLMAAAVVAGQFGGSAPGASIVGQGLVIMAALLGLAPWLAAAALAGMAIPRLRNKRS